MMQEIYAKRATIDTQQYFIFHFLITYPCQQHEIEKDNI